MPCSLNTYSLYCLHCLLTCVSVHVCRHHSTYCHLLLFLHGIKVTLSALALSNYKGSFHWVIVNSLSMRKMQNLQRKLWLLIILEIFTNGTCIPLKCWLESLTFVHSVTNTFVLWLNHNNSHCYMTWYGREMCLLIKKSWMQIRCLGYLGHKKWKHVLNEKFSWI